MNFYISDIFTDIWIGFAYYKMSAWCSALRCTSSNKEGYCCTFAQDANSR